MDMTFDTPRENDKRSVITGEQDESPTPHVGRATASSPPFRYGGPLLFEWEVTGGNACGASVAREDAFNGLSAALGEVGEEAEGVVREVALAGVEYAPIRTVALAHRAASGAITWSER